MDGLYGVHNIFRGSVAGKISANPGSDALQKGDFIANDINQQNQQFRTGPRILRIPVRSCSRFPFEERRRISASYMAGTPVVPGSGNCTGASV